MVKCQGDSEGETDNEAVSIYNIKKSPESCCQQSRLRQLYAEAINKMLRQEQ